MTLKIILKTIISIVGLIFLIYLGRINLALYYTPDYQKEKTFSYNKDVQKQLEHLRIKMDNGAATNMQNLYPEGYMFMYALYGLTWTDYALTLNKNTAQNKTALQEVDEALSHVFSANGTAPFAKEQRLSYGAYYVGWTNYLLGKRLQIKQDDALQARFQNTCDSIAKAIENSPTPYLSSYTSSSWPADMMLCIASLCLHDQIYEARYEQSVQDWLTKVKSQLDPHGLIPHETHHETGKAIEAARGCSQSLMLNFLFEIDPDFAQTQFDIYKEKFLTYRFGLPGIREYPKGTKGFGDIDSGPVILQVGGAASLVGQRTMLRYGEYEISKGIRNSIEGFGWASQNAKTKKYLFGALPVADAFIAWSNVLDIPDEKVGMYQDNTNWRLIFQLISIGFSLLTGGLLFLFWKKK